jgi:dihydroorotase
MPQRLCIKNGEVFFPELGKFEKKDLLIAQGTIARIADSLQPGPEDRSIDARGKLVTPGLIDFHVHAFKYGHLLSIDVDELAWRSGTTGFVDAGSSGALNFLAFKNYVARQTDLNLFAFLNVSGLGQSTDGINGLHFYETDHPDLMHIASAREVIEKNRDIIMGVKVRMYFGRDDMTPMKRARELADQVGLPIMVHLSPPPPELSQLLPYLAPGDIITHPYHGGELTMLDGAGRVRPEFREARELGIEVDVGMDRFHCDLGVMQRALQQGYEPDYIGSDVVIPSLTHIVFDLPTTISKFLAAGMPLEDALYKCTAAAANKIGLRDDLGLIREGGRADLALFELVQDGHVYQDYFGNSLPSTERLLPVLTINQGEVLGPVSRKTESFDFVIGKKVTWES